MFLSVYWLLKSFGKTFTNWIFCSIFCGLSSETNLIPSLPISFQEFSTWQYNWNLNLLIFRTAQGIFTREHSPLSRSLECWNNGCTYKNKIQQSSHEVCLWLFHWRAQKNQIPTFLFLSPPNSKCLHLLMASILLDLQLGSTHSSLKTIFFVVLA